MEVNDALVHALSLLCRRLRLKHSTLFALGIANYEPCNDATFLHGQHGQWAMQHGQWAMQVRNIGRFRAPGLQYHRLVTNQPQMHFIFLGLGLGGDPKP